MRENSLDAPLVFHASRITSPPRSFRNQSSIFLIPDPPRNRTTNLFESREVPQVRKIAALLRLHRLDRTIVAVEKNAFAARLLLQRQTGAVRSQPRELLDELELAHPPERRQPRDFRVAQPHLSRPPATGGAALAFVEDRHAPRLGAAAGPAKSEWSEKKARPESGAPCFGK